MNRRTFALGSLASAVVGLVGIKQTEAAPKTSKPELRIYCVGEVFKNSFYDDDGNFFAAEEMAHTRDSIDYLFKMYPAAYLRQRASGGTDDSYDPHSRESQMMYRKFSLSTQEMLDMSPEEITERINLEFYRFMQTYYQIRDRGFDENWIRLYGVYNNYAFGDRY